MNSDGMPERSDRPRGLGAPTTLSEAWGVVLARLGRHLCGDSALSGTFETAFPASGRPPAGFTGVTRHAMCTGMRETNVLELPGMPEPAPLRPGTGAWAKHELQRFQEISIAEGGLIPPSVAAELMGLHRSRVGQFMETGQLHRVEIAGRPYVSVREVGQLLMQTRPSHRPAKQAA